MTLIISPVYSEQSAFIYLASIRAESLKARIERNRKRIEADESELEELEEAGKVWEEKEKEKQSEIHKFGKP